MLHFRVAVLWEWHPGLVGEVVASELLILAGAEWLHLHWKYKQESKRRSGQITSIEYTTHMWRHPWLPENYSQKQNMNKSRVANPYPIGSSFVGIQCNRYQSAEADTYAAAQSKAYEVSDQKCWNTTTQDLSVCLSLSLSLALSLSLSPVSDVSVCLCLAHICLWDGRCLPVIVMFCDSVLQSFSNILKLCVAIAFCNYVCCNCVLQLSAAIMCCNCVLW